MSIGGSAERINIKCGVGQATTKQLMVCVVETVWEANDLKNKTIFRFSKIFPALLKLITDIS